MKTSDLAKGSSSVRKGVRAYMFVGVGGVMRDHGIVGARMVSAVTAVVRMEGAFTAFVAVTAVVAVTTVRRAIWTRVGTVETRDFTRLAHCSLRPG